ncbi:MAG: energy transducer TonB [Bacteroidota bacterium]
MKSFILTLVATGSLLFANLFSLQAQMGDIVPMAEAQPTPFDFYAQVQEPQPLNYRQICRQIEYPQLAVNAAIEGSVQVRILVDERGAYQDHMLMSSPDPMLSDAVLLYLKSIQFEPALEQDQPVEAWVSLRFSFVTEE